jgi:hypothetical protein
LFSGFRSLDIGYDTIGHIEYFKLGNNFYKAISFKEPGYTLLSYIVIFLKGNFNLFLIIYSLISLIILIKFIKKYSYYPFMSLYVFYSLYFFHQNMSRLRLSMSVMILMVSLNYLYKKRKIKFILTVFLAASFHVSSLIFLLLLVFDHLNLTRKKIISLLLISIFSGLFFTGYFYREILVNLESYLSIGYFGLNRLLRYASIKKYSVRTGGWGGFAYHLGQSILLLYFYNFIDKFKRKEIVIFKTYLLGLILYFFFFDIPVLGRLSIGFRFTEIIIITYYIKLVKDKNLRITFVMIMLLVIFIFGFKGFTNYYDYFIPFHYFWE